MDMSFLSAAFESTLYRLLFQLLNQRGGALLRSSKRWIFQKTDNRNLRPPLRRLFSRLPSGMGWIQPGTLGDPC